MNKVLNKEVLVEVENHCRKLKFTSVSEEEDYQGVTDAVQSLLTQATLGLSFSKFSTKTTNVSLIFVRETV